MRRECVILTDPMRSFLEGHTEALGSVRGRGSEGKMGTRAFIVVSMGRRRRGRVDKLWLVILFFIFKAFFF